MPTSPRLVLLAAALLTTAATHAQSAPRPSLSGDWTGKWPLEFTVHLTDPAGGPRTATLDIADQNAMAWSAFQTPGDSVYLRLSKPMTAQFAGRRSADGQQLVANGSRACGVSAHAQPRGRGKLAGPNRPQTPRRPSLTSRPM